LIFQWNTLAQLILNFRKINIASELQKIKVSVLVSIETFLTQRSMKRHELKWTCSQDEVSADLFETLGRKFKSQCTRSELGKAVLNKGLYSEIVTNQ
jgi:hypothetical protein